MFVDFLGVDVPDDVIGQADHLVARSLGHFGEALGLGLVFERVTREVDTWKTIVSSYFANATLRVAHQIDERRP